MKILQVTPRYPPQTGGVETHVREISERLVERGHEVTVFTADAGASGFRRERRNGVRVRRYRSFAPDGAMHVCPQIIAAVRRADADIVHAHNYHSFPLVFAAFGAGDGRVVVTPHYHAGSADSVRDRLLSLYRLLGQWALRRADAVIAVSEWEGEKLQKDFGVDSQVLPNGLNRDRFRSAEPETRERPYLFCAGRLEEYKGVQYAIEALSQLPEYDLLIAGSGPFRKFLEQAAEEVGVSERVAFLGYVDSGRLPRLYAGAEVYLTLSSFESYGMTVGEALGAGTPCVVRTAGALTDWTERSGVIGVTDVDPKSVAAAVNKAQGRALDETVPRWDDTIDGLVELYKTVSSVNDRPERRNRRTSS